VIFLFSQGAYTIMT